MLARRRACQCGARWSTIERKNSPVEYTTRSASNTLPVAHRYARNVVSPPLPVASQPPTGSVRGVGGVLPSGSVPGPELTGSLSDLRLDLSQGSDPARAKRKKRQETAAFVAFYTAYPRHVARGAAWRMWVSEGCEVLASEIMAALVWQVPQVFAKAPKDKVPHPASWLHGGRWTDEKPGAVVARPPRPSGPPVAIAELAAARSAQLEQRVERDRAAASERFKQQQQQDAGGTNGTTR
jgi:hypothetical protein